MMPSLRDRDHAFFGHPIGLMTLFSTELWERFSYYGMRAILLYFLTDTMLHSGLGIDDATGKAVVATYSSSVFLLSVIGGWVSDRLFGPRKATLYGGIIIILGHITLAIPIGGLAYLGIALVAIGSGVLKPNISTMVGELYDAKDRRRDAAFSIFYLGINLGSFLSPIIVGWVKAAWGYHAGFSVAAIGMAIALVFFIQGRKYIDDAADVVPNPIPADQRGRVWRSVALIVIGLVILWVVIKLAVGLDVLHASVTTLNVLALLLPLGYFFVMYRSPNVTRPERSRLRAFFPLFIAAALFWMIFEQAASSLSLFAEKSTRLLRVGEFTFTPEMYQSVNPLVIILLAGAFAAMWSRLGSRPSTATKFAMGLGLAALGFIFQGTMAAHYAGTLAPWWVLFVTYFILTLGELCLSPVGLAASTLLAPQAFKSQGMALYLMASAFGQSIAALIFAYVPGLTHAQEFFLFAGIALVFTLILAALVPWINRSIQRGFAVEKGAGEQDEDEDAAAVASEA